jgi:4'-phosphopantetheinyl transferase
MSHEWNSVDALPPLENDEVQLWRIELDDTTGLLDRYASLLNTAEQTRANRRSVGQVRDHFTIGRACLRLLLGNALAMDAHDVDITKGIHGKPEIKAIGERSVSFNLAHSKDTILIALRRHGALGVDVEHIDRSADLMDVARDNFTENESNSLAAIADPQERLRTFYIYWTRKEAIGKADGRGLLLPMASFDVSFETMDSQPIQVSSPGVGDQLYFVSDLNVGDKAAAALALESPVASLSKFIFPLRSSW